jgi:hypothetical protein
MRAASEYCIDDDGLADRGEVFDLCGRRSSLKRVHRAPSRPSLVGRGGVAKRDGLDIDFWGCQRSSSVFERPRKTPPQDGISSKDEGDRSSWEGGAAQRTRF